MSSNVYRTFYLLIKKRTYHETKKKTLLLKRKLIKNGNILEILQILKIEPHPVEIKLIQT